MSREKNVEIFNDTERLCKENQRLRKTVEQSNQGQYVLLETDELKVEAVHRFMEAAEIIVSKKRSLEAAGAYRDRKVCVHNFASATNPGGGVTKGSNAQEEAICRCSTLYFNINEDKVRNTFHSRHKSLLKAGNLNAAYNDDCIYTPDVAVFKTDTAEPKLMPEKDWYHVDVITCAAPNLRENPSNRMNPGSGSQSLRLKDSELKKLHIKRMGRILEIAKKEQEDVVILGAFGCGAFMNPPKVVAEAMAAVLEQYKYDFQVIEFAVYCAPGQSENYDTFCRILRK
ncbi:MAG: TIGR02452 family protein [Acetatifactor sp.]|nr:TIGR02452 family protein [Acetatifactor sp.]